MGNPTGDRFIFLAGAQKSGTSSLFQQLSRHPSIRPSEPKETNFFSQKQNLTSPDKLFDCFPNDRSEPARFLEGSTSYLYEPYVTDRIAEFFDRSPKFLFIFRDPAKRAVSAYWHHVKHGREFRSITDVFEQLENSLNADEIHNIETKSITHAIDRGSIKLQSIRDRYDDPYWSFRYVSNGFYERFLSHYRDMFPERNIMTTSLNDITNRPEKCFKRIARFLNLKFVENWTEVKKQNVTRIPAFPSIMDPTKKWLKKNLPKWTRSVIKRVGITGLYYRIATNSKPRTPKSIQERLNAIYDSSWSKFQTLLVDA